MQRKPMIWCVLATVTLSTIIIEDMIEILIKASYFNVWYELAKFGPSCYLADPTILNPSQFVQNFMKVSIVVLKHDFL